MRTAPEDADPDGPERAESGRPRVPRPMPDTSTATQCPHCGADVGTGHYVCWNCSRDVRMKERTESDIMGEYQTMLAREELRLEARNQRFYVGVTGFAAALGGIGAATGYLWGSMALVLLFGAIMARFFVRSKRREIRLRKTHPGVSVK